MDHLKKTKMQSQKINNRTTEHKQNKMIISHTTSEKIIRKPWGFFNDVDLFFFFVYFLQIGE